MRSIPYLTLFSALTLRQSQPAGLLFLDPAPFGTRTLNPRVPQFDAKIELKIYASGAGIRQGGAKQGSATHRCLYLAYR